MILKEISNLIEETLSSATKGMSAEIANMGKDAVVTARIDGIKAFKRFKNHIKTISKVDLPSHIKKIENELAKKKLRAELAKRRNTINDTQDLLTSFET